MPQGTSSGRFVNLFSLRYFFLDSHLFWMEMFRSAYLCNGNDLLVWRIPAVRQTAQNGHSQVNRVVSRFLWKHNA